MYNGREPFASVRETIKFVQVLYLFSFLEKPKPRKCVGYFWNILGDAVNVFFSFV